MPRNILTKSKSYICIEIEDSSIIKSCSYDKSKSLLNVKFSNGSVYSYENVSYSRFANLVKAESVGSYFAKHIKSKYSFAKRETGIVSSELMSLTPSFN